MPHKFMMQDIAKWSGTSLATVDRFLHKRGGVHQKTALKIERALREMEIQHQSGNLDRRLSIDVVMSSAMGCAHDVRVTLEAIANSICSTPIQINFHEQQLFSEADAVSILRSIERTGSKGILLCILGGIDVAGEVNRLIENGVPVVTIGNDISNSNRSVFISLNSDALGKTAAYLFQQCLGTDSGGILLPSSSERNRFENVTVAGFRRTLKAISPSTKVFEIALQSDVTKTVELLRTQLAEVSEISGVFSFDGEAELVMRVLEEMDISCKVHIAKDLSKGNLRRLRSGEVQLVLRSDLSRPLRQAICQILKPAHCAGGSITQFDSIIDVFTPFNLPKVGM